MAFFTKVPHCPIENWVASTCYQERNTRAEDIEYGSGRHRGNCEDTIQDTAGDVGHAERRWLATPGTEQLYLHQNQDKLANLDHLRSRLGRILD